MNSGSSQNLPDQSFWRGRRVLLTGHTGFKGSWLTCWLQALGATVMGISLPETPTKPSLYEQLALSDVVDVRADITMSEWMPRATDFSPEIVFHLAAQSLVAVGMESPFRTFEVNVLGTARLMSFLDSMKSLRSAIVVTTDKVYSPSSMGAHAETHSLGGSDPYAASKAAAEMVVAGWPAFDAPCATARAGNVIGGGDWAGNRLLPDLMRAWLVGVPVTLRHPDAIRPWQHVLEPLCGYLLYAEALASGRALPSAMNFGPAAGQAVQVGEVVDFAAKYWETIGRELPMLPFELASSVSFPETAELQLDSRLAAETLGWSQVFDWRRAVELTIDWYVGQDEGSDPHDLVRRQLDDFLTTARGAA